MSRPSVNATSSGWMVDDLSQALMRLSPITNKSIASRRNYPGRLAQHPSKISSETGMGRLPLTFS